MQKPGIYYSLLGVFVNGERCHLIQKYFPLRTTRLEPLRFEGIYIWDKESLNANFDILSAKPPGFAARTVKVIIYPYGFTPRFDPLLSICTGVTSLTVRCFSFKLPPLPGRLCRLYAENLPSRKLLLTLRLMTHPKFSPPASLSFQASRTWPSFIDALILAREYDKLHTQHLHSPTDVGVDP
jgi:hypothetical protein